MDTSSRISKIRSRERERLRGPQWLKVSIYISMTRSSPHFPMKKETEEVSSLSIYFVYIYLAIVVVFFVIQFNLCLIILVKW